MNGRDGVLKYPYSIPWTDMASFSVGKASITEGTMKLHRAFTK